MQKRNHKQNEWRVNFFLLTTGVGIGWLAGLSVSPVVSIIVTSITGSAAAIVATLSGLKDSVEDEEKAENKAKSLRWGVDPAPVAMLVIGLFFGSTAGIWVRTHDWLSSRPLTLTEEITRWTTAGLPQDIVVNKLFESKYPSFDTSSAGQPTTAPFQASVLFTEAVQEECKTLTPLVTKQNYAQLQTELRSSAAPSFRALPTIITDTVKLAQVVEKVLCASTQP